MTDNMIFVDFGLFTIYWHGIFMGLNIFLTILIFSYLCKKQSVSFYFGLTAALISASIALVTSRIFYCWFSQAAFSNGINDFLDLMSGGYAMYGALLGVLITLLLYSVVKKRAFWQILDAAVPAISFSIAIGRFASITSNSDIGFSVSNKLLQRFPVSVWSESEQSWFLWVGFFEGIIAAIIFIITLTVFLMKYKYGKKALSFGDTTLLFMLIYGLSQSMLESMRNDSLFMVSLGFVRINQIISILLAVIAVVIIIVKGCFIKRPVAANIIMWVICLAALGMAVYCEFTMSATTMVMNYVIMGASLLTILLIALFMFSSNINKKSPQIQTEIN